MPRHYRFYLESIPQDGFASISGAEHHHLTRVLRLSIGDIVELFDGNGTCASAELTESRRTNSVVMIREWNQTEKSQPTIHLALAIAKSKQTESVIRMCTELGVTELQPISSQRTVVRSSDSKRLTNKWTRITIEAAKQCGVDYLPVVKPVMSFVDFVTDDHAGFLRLIPHPHNSVPLKTKLRDSDTTQIMFVIGPEGGFSDDEVQAASNRGFQAVSLGPNILRVETACLMAVSAAVYEFTTKQTTS